MWDSQPRCFAFSYTHRPQSGLGHEAEVPHPRVGRRQSALTKATHESATRPSPEGLKGSDLAKIPTHSPIQNRPPTNPANHTH